MDQSQNQSGLNSNSSCRVNGGPPIPPQDLITLVPSSRPKTEKTRLAKSKSKGKYGDQHETSFRVRGKQAPAILAEVQQSEDDRPLFEGILHWTGNAIDIPLVAALMKSLQSKFKVSISIDRSLPGISITGPTVSDIGDVLEALKLALQLEEAEQALTETTYMVLPPNKDAMRAKIIGARDVRNGQTIFLPTLTGEQLDGNEAADWTRKVGTYQQNVEDRLQDYLTQGLKELSRLRTTMRLRVVFGTIALTRCKEQFKQPGLIYDEFVEMMSNTMLGGLFYKNIRNGSLCHKVNQVIGQTPQTFCHPEKHPKKLKDVGPSHTFVYCTEENGGNIRFEANVTHNAYEDFLLSESALYRGDYTIGDLEPGVRRRLDARVLSLEGNHHWSVVASSKKTIEASFTHIFRRVKGMLSQKGGTDDSGIHYPTLREGRVLRPYERVWTETTFTYGLVGLPYRLEIALCRQLYGQGKSAAHTEFRMYAPAWDIAMGGTEGLMCDEWDHGVDLEALFPANDWDVQGTGRFGSFIAAVERVKSFLVEASKRAPNAEDTLELSEDRGFDGN